MSKTPQPPIQPHGQPAGQPLGQPSVLSADGPAAGPAAAPTAIAEAAALSGEGTPAPAGSLALRPATAPARQGTGGGASTPTVALALGAGGARGFAHVHALAALEELGIEPVAIAGSSIGAIIGAGKAAGMGAEEIRDYALKTVGNRGAVAKALWGLRPPTMRHAIGGFRLGQFNLERILRAFLPPQIPERFEDLGLPLKVVATDYYGHCERLCVAGDLYQALAASAAIPALFMPVMLDGRLMIDGGIFNPVPYEHVLDCADITIGVDIVGGPVGEGQEVPNRIDSLFGASQLMMQSHLALKLTLGPPTIFLRPPVNGFGVMDFLKARQIFDVSEPFKDEVKRAVEAAIEQRLRG